MDELFAGPVATRHRSGVPAVVSLTTHAAFVALVIALAPAVGPPTRMHAVALLRMPAPGLGATPAQAGARPPAPAPDLDADGAIPLQAAKVVVGALDQPRPLVGTIRRLEEAGEVVLGGFGGGAPDGNRFGSGGTLGSTGAFTPSRSAPVMAALTIPPEEDEPAQLLSAPTPSYTDEAKRLNITGEVVLEVTLTASGQVRVRRVLSGLGHGLDEAAIDAANKARCRPARRAGRPIDVVASIAVVFELT